jgi:DNA-binding transcriptional ArsR family regulator
VKASKAHSHAAAREEARPGSKARRAAPPTDVDSTLAALADPYRRKVVNLLRQRPHAAGELAQQLELPAPAMSRHLRVLRQSGLVEERHPEFDARVRIYSLRLEPMAGLKAWLQETEQLWADQLGSFKAHVEQG